MFRTGTILDRYILRQTIGTFAAIVGIVMSLMVLEHLPRLIEITRLSGHRGYIVAQTVAGLLPEYIGIGLVVGLYLAIALTVRRLAMRGELDAIEANGVGPWRWMRMPALLAVAVAALTFVNQGWLMPAGEARLTEIGHRMAIGDFGYNISAGQLVDLGPDNVLTFQSVDHETGYLQSIFLKSEDQAFTAARGRLSIAPDGEAIVELLDGQAVDETNGRVLHFNRIRYHTTKPDVAEEAEDGQADPLKSAPLDALLSSGLIPERAVAFGRILWIPLALLMPAIAFVLGKPPQRATGAVGIFVGLALLVLFLKTLSPLSDGQADQPGILASVLLLGWSAATAALLKLENSLGRGFVDRFTTRLIGKAQPRRKPARRANSIPRSRRIIPDASPPLPAE